MHHPLNKFLFKLVTIKKLYFSRTEQTRKYFFTLSIKLLGTFETKKKLLRNNLGIYIFSVIRKKKPSLHLFSMLSYIKT